MHPLSPLRRRMPNYRTFTVQHGEHMLKLRANPVGWRRLPVLRSIPFITGSGTQVEAEVEAVSRKEGTQRWIEVGINLVGDNVIGGQTERYPSVPLKRQSVLNYLSVPGECRYEVFIRTTEHAAVYTVADFSVIAKDRFMVALFLSGGAVLLTALNLVW